MNVLLRGERLDAGYRKTAVVRQLDMAVSAGEVVAVLGPNGAGKTTTLLTLAGLIPPLGGTVSAPDRRGEHHRARRRRNGVVLVSDDRSLFRSMTARENLLLACSRHGPSVDDALDFIPQLGARLHVRAGLLSGGEQQMLAIGRALLQQPNVLLIDELSMGLAPVVVEHLLQTVRRIATDMAAGVVLVEQHVRLALETADRALVLVHGRKALEGPAAELLERPHELEQAYLGG